LRDNLDLKKFREQRARR
jgi:hypothetical protein